MKGKVLLLVSALLILPLAIALAAGPEVRVAHPFIGNEEFAPYFQAAMSAFAEANKAKLTLKLEGEQGDDLRTKIKTDMAAGKLADIYWSWPGGQIEPMVKAGLALDVRKYVEKSKVLKWDQIAPKDWSAYKSASTDGFFGIPMGGIKIYLVANKTLFAKYGVKYPKTIDELKAVAKVFNANGIIPLAVGSKGGNTSHWLYAHLVYQYITETDTYKIISKGWKFTEPVMVKCAQMVLDLAQAGVFPKDTMTNSEYAPVQALYNERKAAMVYGFPWTSGNFTDEIAAESDVIDFPRTADAKFDPVKWTIGGINDGFSINKKSFNDAKKTQAIVSVMDVIMTDESWAAWGKAGRSILKKGVSLPKEGLPPMAVKSFDFSRNQETRQNLWILLPGAVSQEAFVNQLDALWAQSVSADEYAKTIQASVDKGK